MSSASSRPVDDRELRTPEDVVTVRQLVRQKAVELGFNLVDQTKLVMSASELARNAIQHGGGGMVNIAQAMTDGFSTAAGLGLGLGGARRLSNDFSIDSSPGRGTRVTIVRWR